MTATCSVVMMTALIASGGEAAPYQKLVKTEALRAGAEQWRVIDYRAGGVSRVNETALDPSGQPGVLEQILPVPSTDELSAEVEILSWDTVHDPIRGLVPQRGGFGRVWDLDKLAFSWLRDSASTITGFLGPAIRVYVYDPDASPNGTSYVMIWEPVYNGLNTAPGWALPTDVWQRTSIEGHYFWRAPLYIDGAAAPRRFCADNPQECYVFNRRLQDWGFSPRAVIFGLSIAAGSGWSGSYYRALVDHVELKARWQHLWWDFSPADKWAWWR